MYRSSTRKNRPSYFLFKTKKETKKTQYEQIQVRDGIGCFRRVLGTSHRIKPYQHSFARNAGHLHARPLRQRQETAEKSALPELDFLEDTAKATSPRSTKERPTYAYLRFITINSIALHLAKSPVSHEHVPHHVCATLYRQKAKACTTPPSQAPKPKCTPLSPKLVERRGKTKKKSKKS